jgi:hypothetical protein
LIVTTYLLDRQLGALAQAFLAEGACPKGGRERDCGKRTEAAGAAPRRAQSGDFRVELAPS